MSVDLLTLPRTPERYFVHERELSTMWARLRDSGDDEYALPALSLCGPRRQFGGRRPANRSDARRVKRS